MKGRVTLTIEQFDIDPRAVIEVANLVVPVDFPLDADVLDGWLDAVIEIFKLFTGPDQRTDP